MRCPACHADISSNANFCRKCGAKIRKVTEQLILEMEPF